MSTALPNTPISDVFISCRAQLQGLAHRIVGRFELAEEVVQDAYLKIAEGACAACIDRPQAYCCQVVRNLALDCYRRQSLESSHRVYTDDGELPQVPCLITPERLLDERRQIAAVDRALGELPSRTRQAFELNRLAGMTQREVGQALGCSATLVNFMIKDAMEVVMGCRTPGAAPATC